MATLVLQAVGTAVGTMIGGPIGGAIGSAVGAMAGSVIDQSIINSFKSSEGPRLGEASPMSADEGGMLPRVYGTARLSTTLIWGTRFEEEKTTKRQGGKGGPKVTTYSYYGNFAVALCHGEISTIRRIWADGVELDLRDIDYRLYLGNSHQEADPLIADRQKGAVPAYRDTAYIVFERLPLELYGNRVPQIEVEVIRAVGELEKNLTAIALIPGATEHGLSPVPVTRRINGKTLEVNRHVLHGETDFSASLDELCAICPNLKHVSLVVAWYGNDLRAGKCVLKPGIMDREDYKESAIWQVSGVRRDHANTHVISNVSGRSAYGGTPSDESVIAAIRDLKARGLKVTLNPFVLMDIPKGSGLPDPYGGAEQAHNPWRGRITVSPAPGQSGTVDRTTAATTQIAGFCGNTLPGHIVIFGDKLRISSSADWGYRRMILHYARLAQLAGGVDAFLIGSELRGLTQIRGASDTFPFVDALRQLASDVRSIVGSATKITYGADWSEYFGYQPQDGSGDVYYNLDPLWMSPAIDAIGIDNYMPLSDWRERDAHAPMLNPDGMVSNRDSAGMAAAVQSGEGYDWYYASSDDRASRQRSPITDGQHQKPWVFRYKDILSWWSNPHKERRGSVELDIPTSWVPKSKPVWFTECGCPSIYGGATSPNLFLDANSSENAMPPNALPMRDDAEQRAYIDAQQKFWREMAESAPTQGDVCVDPERIYLWAWDARAFPAFPMSRDVWADGDNWVRGHWLNSRLGTAPLSGIIGQCVEDYGLEPLTLEGIQDVPNGFVASGATTARSVLETLADTYGYDVCDTGTLIRATTAVPRKIIDVSRGDMVFGEDDYIAQDHYLDARDRPNLVVASFRDPLRAYIVSTVYSHRDEALDDRTASMTLPVQADSVHANEIAERQLQRLASRSHRLKFKLPLRFATLETGDMIRVVETGGYFQIRETVFDRDVSVIAERFSAPSNPIHRDTLPKQIIGKAAEGNFGGPPDLLVLDMSERIGQPGSAGLWVAGKSQTNKPLQIYTSEDSEGFVFAGTLPDDPAIGTLIEALPGTSANGRQLKSQKLKIAAPNAEFSSVSNTLLLAGRNFLAVQKEAGWEILQFQFAEETATGVWELSGLIRGQSGTEDLASLTASQGAICVLLDDQLAKIESVPENGAGLYIKAAEAGRSLTERYATTIAVEDAIRFRQPFAPVHLIAKAKADGLHISWVRRDPVSSDSWDGEDIPLSFSPEKYMVTVGKAGDETIASRIVTTPDLIFTLADIAEWPVASGEPVTIAVAQLSPRSASGIAARITHFI